MKIRIRPYDGSPCELKIFTINDIEAEIEDFGEYNNYGNDPCFWGCSDRRFTPTLPTSKILDKYKINVDEYKEVCEELSKKLKTGSCYLCS